jgi:hypothetical protein
MKNRTLAITLCFILLVPVFSGCGADGGATAAPPASRTTGSPQATISPSTPSPSPAATPAPTAIPSPPITPSPDGITPADGFAAPEGDGLPIGELALEHGGYVYYCDGDGLWRVDGKLKGKTKVLKAAGAIRQFFFDAAGTPYYTEETPDGNGGHSICLYRYRDGKASLLADGIAGITHVDGKTAYYAGQRDADGHKLFACDLETGEKKLCLSSDRAKDFYFRSGFLYFTDEHDQLFAKDLRTGQSGPVFPKLSALVYNRGDWALNFKKADGHPVFEAYRYSDRSLRTVRLDESIPRAFPPDMLFSVLAFDGKNLYLCYNGYEEAATFFRVDAATGKAVKRLKADQCSVLCVSGNTCYIFTGTYSDGGAPRNLNVWACNMAAGTKALMKRLPAKTGMVEEMAAAGGYVWGFGSTEKAAATQGGGTDTLYLHKYLFALPGK